MKIAKLSSIFILLLQIGVGFSQEEENWMLMEEKEALDTTQHKVDFSAEKKGKLTVDKDVRIPKLLSKLGEEDLNGRHTIKGYRVQLFFDKDKSKINQEKAKFKMRFGNSIGCYVEYKAPNYRIKVGDFRTEIEAERYKQNLLGLFPTAFVVKEKINLPKIETGEEDEN